MRAFFDCISMIYDDLLTVPFKLNGRDKDGMDCYGLCIEMCKRDGKELKDLLITHQTEDQIKEDAEKINVMEISEDDARAGDIVQCTWNHEIHIAFMLNKKTVIHATTSGVRINSLLSLVNRKYFRVV